MPPRVSCLVAALGPFGAELAARQAAHAVAKGLGPVEADVLALDSVEGMPAEERFEERMRASRALVLVQDRLTPELLAGSLTEELATRARQSGVPAYAIVRERGIDAFGARVLDLQVILEAGDERALRKAARELAKLI